ncbi:MAG: hypothetical protein HKN25_16325 [Pyrinomonadaceae bacterium]|nr:hypothetical protein [Pyrinomonadaceae bacterium]
MNQLTLIWKSKRGNYWTDSAIDTWVIEERDLQITLKLVTQRRQKILGTRSLVFNMENSAEINQMIGNVFKKFYKVYIPKEIRIFKNDDVKRSLLQYLDNKFGKHLTFKNQTELLPTLRKGLLRNRYESALQGAETKTDYKKVAKRLKKIFKLNKMPKKIEAYDVAHISGKNMVASKTLWLEGKQDLSRNEAWPMDKTNEPEALMEALRVRLRGRNSNLLPDLILIDGGKAQLKAAIRGAKDLADREFKLVAAVKPAGEAGKIAYFLDEGFNKIVSLDDAAHRFLINVRDSSHNLANQLHGEIRDKSPMRSLLGLDAELPKRKWHKLLKKAGSIAKLRTYSFNDLAKLIGEEDARKAFQVLDKHFVPFKLDGETIIPIRFDERGGDAEDLQPLKKLRL